MSKNDIILKETINEKLSSLKKKNIIEKREIINRYNLIIENKNLNKKSDLNRFCLELIRENQNLISEGYNQELISEQFNEWAQWLMGTTGKGLLGYFKEYITRSILKSLGIDTKTWYATAIIVIIGNLTLSDLLKVGNCDFWVEKLRTALIDYFIIQWQKKKGVDEDVFSSTLRNAIGEMIDSTTFAQVIDKKITETICPVISNLGGKISSVMSKLSGAKQA